VTKGTCHSQKAGENGGRDREIALTTGACLSQPLQESQFPLWSLLFWIDTMKYDSLRVTNAKFPSSSPVRG